MSKADALIARAREAAQVRGYQTDPDVIALRMETSRAWVERLGWSGLVLGLLFTMVNVQTFAARGAEAWSAVWVTAWLLDPMVSLVLLAVLLGESMTSRWQLPTERWVRATKWVALGATYAMNTWHSWAAVDVAGILLHSVPPALVFFAAEALPQLRHQMTEAIERAHAAARSVDRVQHTASTRAEVTDTPATGTTGEPAGPGWVAAGERPILPITVRPDTAPGTGTAGGAPAAASPARSNPEQPRRAARPRADKGRKLPAAAKPHGAVKARPVEELARQLDTLIGSGDLTAEASVNATRKALGCSPQRAKEAAAYRRQHLRPAAPDRHLTATPDAEQEAA